MQELQNKQLPFRRLLPHRSHVHHLHGNPKRGSPQLTQELDESLRIKNIEGWEDRIKVLYDKEDPELNCKEGERGELNKSEDNEDSFWVFINIKEKEKQNQNQLRG